MSYGFSLSGLPVAGFPPFPTKGAVTRREPLGRSSLSMAPVIKERIEVRSAAERRRSSELQVGKTAPAGTDMPLDVFTIAERNDLPD
jgi:hypothetical protein